MKTKYIKISLGLFLVSLLFVKCSEDYLETEPSKAMSGEQIARASKLNPDLQKGSLAGVYSILYSQGTGGTDLNHQDFGHKSYDIASDILTGDMVIGGLNYPWYQDIGRYQATTDYTKISTYMPWRFYYRIIFGANQVIDGLGGTDAVLEKEDAKYIMGQAKAMRAFAYFYLANYFSNEYEPSKKILPIYTNTADPNKALSSTEDVYKLIVSDLTTAISFLDTFNRTGKQEVNVHVAKGLLAYVYSTMGKYKEAATLANDVIDSGKFTLMTAEEITGGFNDISTSGWIWGVDLTLDMGLDLVSFWGHVDYFSYSYAWAGDPKIINWDLFLKISEDDARKKQFYPKSTYSIPYKKFYDSRRKAGLQRQMISDYVYMRVAEMYLLKAENLAKNGEELEAKTALKTLLNSRIPDVSYVDNLSGDALLNEIYLQTRIELWGEGKIYLAMKRNKKTIKRASNDLLLPGQSFSYNDDKLSYDIPQSEVLNNPQIK